MDTQNLETQLHEAELALLKARAAAEEAKNKMTFYRRARAAILHSLPLHDSILKNDLKQYSDSLPSHDGITWQLLNNDHTVAAEQEQRQQDIINAKNEMAEWKAKVIPIRSQLFAAQSAIITAQTSIEQLQADIAAGVLTAPMTGQVLRQYVKDGDWVAQGDKVLQIMDLHDVNMKFSLPAYHAAALAIGTEVRLVLDLPSPVVLPAQISSIAPNTASLFAIWNELVDQQQQQIVVKAKIAYELLKTCACDLTDGVIGRAYVRFDKSVQWPTDLNDSCQDCYRLEDLYNSKTTTAIGN
ncbi:MAG: HlyD family efflux transporter periplasmic adaptor subunit [Desulfobulbus sp.]|nr:HlyD family efflux transporter periplasmic adaptor subunit [Desulfobulbus sp.]